MITYKNKGIYFGGVFDHEGPRHTMQSMFYNDLYAFDFDRKRWYALGLKVPKLGGAAGGDRKKKKQAKKEKKARAEEEGEEGGGKGGDSDSSDDDDSDDDERDENTAEDALEKEHQNGNYFGYIDNDGNVVYINIGDMEDEEGDDNMDTMDGRKEHGMTDVSSDSSGAYATQKLTNPSTTTIISEADVVEVDVKVDVESSISALSLHHASTKTSHEEKWGGGQR